MLRNVYQSEIIDLWKYVENAINQYLCLPWNVNLFEFELLLI